MSTKDESHPWPQDTGQGEKKEKTQRNPPLQQEAVFPELRVKQQNTGGSQTNIPEENSTPEFSRDHKKDNNEASGGKTSQDPTHFKKSVISISEDVKKDNNQADNNTDKGLHEEGSDRKSEHSKNNF